MAFRFPIFSHSIFNLFSLMAWKTTSVKGFRRADVYNIFTIRLHTLLGYVRLQYFILIVTLILRLKQINQLEGSFRMEVCQNY